MLQAPLAAAAAVRGGREGGRQGRVASPPPGRAGGGSRGGRSPAAQRLREVGRRHPRPLPCLVPRARSSAGWACTRLFGLAGLPTLLRVKIVTVIMCLHFRGLKLCFFYLPLFFPWKMKTIEGALQNTVSSHTPVGGMILALCWTHLMYTGCPGKLWLPCPWKCSRAGWMSLVQSRPLESVPMAQGGKKWALRAFLTHTILRFYDSKCSLKVAHPPKSRLFFFLIDNFDEVLRCQAHWCPYMLPAPDRAPGCCIHSVRI